MIRWIDLRAILAAHDRQIAEHGGSAGVRDETLLESALARPQQLYAYGDPPPDLADLAASLGYGLAKNHPFVDGNKRTATVVCEAFINLNDATLEASDEDYFTAILAVADGSMPEKDFAAWLRAQMSTAPRNEVHEKKPKRGRPRKAAAQRVQEYNPDHELNRT